MPTERIGRWRVISSHNHWRFFRITFNVFIYSYSRQIWWLWLKKSGRLDWCDVAANFENFSMRSERLVSGCRAFHFKDFSFRLRSESFSPHFFFSLFRSRALWPGLHASRTRSRQDVCSRKYSVVDLAEVLVKVDEESQFRFSNGIILSGACTTLMTLSLRSRSPDRKQVKKKRKKEDEMPTKGLK